MKKKYDLIFSIGAACSCTQALRSSYLQYVSYPFDWLIGGGFSERINILTSEFDGFIEKKDFSFTTKGINHDVYLNNKTQIKFKHDFSVGMAFNVSYPMVAEKYQRRISRLLNNIKKANSILVVFLETPVRNDKTSDKELILGLEKLNKQFPDKQIDILYFTYNPYMKPKKLKKEIISSNITRFTANYKSLDPKAEKYEVDIPALKKHLKEYRLNLPFDFALKQFIKRTLIYSVPVKSIRKKLKKKFHCY